MKLKIKDGRGELYQWDTGRKIIVEDGPNIDYLHFADLSKDNSVSYSREVTEENGIRWCSIPNACFANESTKLVVYAVDADEDGIATTTTVVFPIRKRQKPSDYIDSPETIISAEEILRKASKKADEAESYMNTSMQYAINPVDEVISGTDKYSSLHWASKANDIYNDVVKYVGSQSDPTSALGSIESARSGAISDVKKQETDSIEAVGTYTSNTAIPSISQYLEVTAKPALKTYGEQQVNSYVNGTSKTELDRYVNNKKQVLDSYVETGKKQVLDNYTAEKKSELDNYTETDKKQVLDSYTENEKKAELDTHAAGLKEQLNAHTVSKSGELNEYTTGLKSELDGYTTAKEQVISEFTEQKKTEIQGVYQTDLNELKGDLSELVEHINKDRKRTIQLYDKWSNNVFPNFYISGSLAVTTPYDRCRAICVPVNVKSDEYYTAVINLGTDILPLNSTSVVRFGLSNSIPKATGESVLQLGATYIGTNYVRGAIHTSTDANYIILQVQFVIGTTDEECDAAILQIADNMMLINSTAYGGYDYTVPYQDYYILDVDEENLSDDLKAKLSHIADGIKPLGLRTIKCGSDILSGVAPTLGAGWSGTLADGFTHTSGNTDSLIFSVPNAAYKEKYIVDFDIESTDTVNSLLYVSIGNGAPVDTYNGKTHFTIGLMVESGTTLNLIPASGFTGAVKNLKLHKVDENGTVQFVVDVNSVFAKEPENDLTGFWNIAMGMSALQNLVNASRNIALGTFSLNTLKSGTRNIGIGTYSLPNLASGDRNISIGADSSYKVKKAVDCVAIGMSALYSGEELNDNIAIGNSALGGSASSKSAHNIAIGKVSGFATTGINNVFVGTRSGMANTSGNNNTFVGVASGVNGNYSDSIAIGNNAQPTKSNQMMLGSTAITEVILCGNKKIIFNTDGTVTWETI